MTYDELRELARDCGYSDGAGFPDEGEDDDDGVDGLIAYKNALEERAMGPNAAQDVLLKIDRYLHPEHYAHDVQEHRYWDDFSVDQDERPSGVSEEDWTLAHEYEYVLDHDVYQWSSDEIEWVSEDVAEALIGDPRAVRR